jgi:phage baseplate assembly protein W
MTKRDQSENSGQNVRAMPAPRDWGSKLYEFLTNPIDPEIVKRVNEEEEEELKKMDPSAPLTVFPVHD